MIKCFQVLTATLVSAFHVAWTNLSTLAVFVTILTGLGGMLYLVVKKRMLKGDAKFEELLLAAGGILIIICYLIIIVSHTWPAIFPYLVVIIFMGSVISCIFLVRFVLPKSKLQFSNTTTLLIPAFLLLVLIRLSFLSGLEFPLYQDSALHYQIINDLQHQSSAPQAFYSLEKLISPHYYHYGFHSIIAVVSAFSNHRDTIRALMLLGQVFVIAAPFTLAFFAKVYTKDTWTYIFTAIAACFGWSMPAYAVNWGKYPAIAAIAFLPVALAWMVILFRSKRGERGLALCLATACLVACLLLHSRSILFLLAALVTFLVMKMLPGTSGRKPVMLSIILLEALLILFLFLTSQNISEAIKTYLEQTNLIMTSIAMILACFAVYVHGCLSLSILTFTTIIFLLSSLPIPPYLSDYLGNTILDRPMIQLVLFAPLSLLSGLGFSGLLVVLSPVLSKPGRIFKAALPYFVSGSLALFLLLSHAVDGDYQPDSCCTIVGEDDIFTLGWMAHNIPDNMQIGIAAQEYLGQELAVDAGVWISPLTGLKTTKYLSTLSFIEPQTHDLICGEQTSYIYWGSTAQGFNILSLETRPDWYIPVFSLPMARLYQVKCANR